MRRNLTFVPISLMSEQDAKRPRLAHHDLPCINDNSSVSSNDEIVATPPRALADPPAFTPTQAADAISALLAMHRSEDSPTKVNTSPATRHLVCPDCQQTFNDHSNFARHRRRHTGEKPYVCSDCNRAFATSTNLVVHRRVHTGERPYACQHCGDSFVDSSSLRKHVRSHTGERPYVCDVPGCVKAFTRSGDLVVHKRVHTGERPYECDWAGCGKSFAQRSTLITHRHSHTGEKPFECAKCQSKFVSTSHLAAHRRLGKCDTSVVTAVCSTTIV